MQGIGDIFNYLDEIAKRMGLPVPAREDLTVPDYELMEVAIFNQNLPKNLAETMGETGTVGTRLINGIVSTEPNSNVRPFQARGRMSGSGVFDEIYRDPVVYQSVQTITSIIATGEFVVHLDQCMDDHPDRQQMLEDARELLSYFKGVKGGFKHFIEELCTGLYRGFALFEVVYKETEDGKIVPAKFAFREQSTVYRWIVDPDGRELVAVEFMTGGDNATSYTLPFDSNKTELNKLIHSGVAITGLNFEGVPATRPIRVLVEYKKLIYMILGAQSERFGCPILLLEPHEALYKETAIKPNQNDWNEYYEAVSAMQALDTPTVKTPFGLTARFLSPQGQSINFEPIIRLIDSSIAQAWHTQAQQLGHGSGGSYALGKVQDGALDKAAPAYAQALLHGVNRLFEVILRNEYGHDAPLLPEIIWSERIKRDDSKWLSDVLAYNAVRASIPLEWQAQIEDRLGLPVTDTPEPTDEIQNEEA